MDRLYRARDRKLAFPPDPVTDIFVYFSPRYFYFRNRDNRIHFHADLLGARQGGWRHTTNEENR